MKNSKFGAIIACFRDRATLQNPHLVLQGVVFGIVIAMERFSADGLEMGNTCVVLKNQSFFAEEAYAFAGTSSSDNLDELSSTQWKKRPRFSYVFTKKCFIVIVMRCPRIVELRDKNKRKSKPTITPIRLWLPRLYP